jgi:solute carrier family 25 carnitine/acylcarnitine transporter 20/29
MVEFFLINLQIVELARRNLQTTESSVNALPAWKVEYSLYMTI